MVYKNRTEEADKVTLRIASILSGKAFKLSSATLLSIHGRLFEGIYDFAGKIRETNISKKEWMLNGDSVTYDDFRNDLVRANYNNRKNGIIATQLYLNRFFGNLLLGERNELKTKR